jgi:hypothetical protein
MVHGNAAQLLKVPRQDVQHSPGSVRLRQKVDVVKLSKHSFAFRELALSSIQGWLDGEKHRQLEQGSGEGPLPGHGEKATPPRTPPSRDGALEQL